ncbi:O-antigen ligase family protein [Patescibacteria group bacterium]|nr:O-antigen ligase family protein [Patescibacteria group bacterium]
MNKLEWQKGLALGVIVLALEIWSYLAFSLPSFSLPIFIFIALIFLVVSVYKIEYALLGIFAELIVGSMGHLFFLELANFRFSIRIVFWLIIVLVFAFKFLLQLIKEKKESLYFQRIKKFGFLNGFFLLFLVLIFGFIKGLLAEAPLTVVIADFNSWLFFLLIFPLLALVDLKNKDFISDLKVVLFSSVVWLSFKTLFLLAVFSHNLSFAAETYYWLRKTLVAEMTVGTWPRIFIQSQIFSGAAFFVFFSVAQVSLKKINSVLLTGTNNFKDCLKNFFTKNNLILILSSALVFSSIILSFSRSFWLAFVLVIGLALILIWRFYNFKESLKSLIWLISSFIVGFCLIYFVTILPFSEFETNNLNKGLNERLTQDSSEPALASRWSLLPVLWSEIKEAPLFGKGFGAEITYISSDPRVLEKNPSGEYRTSAFEWGYLDIWLKIGLLGLLIYLALLLKVIISAFKFSLAKSGLYLGLGLALVFLSIVHFFTPYLNHPLGIGLFIVCTCIIYENKVYLIRKNRNKNKL